MAFLDVATATEHTGTPFIWNSIVRCFHRIHYLQGDAYISGDQVTMNKKTDHKGQIMFTAIKMP